MARYEITFKKSVAKDLPGILPDDIKRMLQRIDTLAEDPRAEGCVKLSSQERYRVRQGVYRIVYEIRDEPLIVQVVKVAHKSSVYKGK
ncbi:MAG: type II toxin-antitoxin system mRNA interferase toxin, RelE/StbE family [Gammaproteobacteria bacterium HGW-Gammaproteobacteria-8]|nr:MAG: type II toxin-antitoxin system mRNA interferase toxin, RelE/StbE family [Gammaproteobacteria bacterium HGW-Gammaproteobacteria-8]